MQVLNSFVLIDRQLIAWKVSLNSTFYLEQNVSNHKGTISCRYYFP